jgi:hypothetical protein
MCRVGLSMPFIDVKRTSQLRAPKSENDPDCVKMTSASKAGRVGLWRACPPTNVRVFTQSGPKSDVGRATALSVPFLLLGSLSAMRCNIRRAPRNK